MSESRLLSSAPPPPPYHSGPQGNPSAPSDPPPKYEAKPGQPYPAQPGYGGQPYPPQGYQAATTTTIYTQPVAVIQTHFGANPALINCPYCHNDVTTELIYEAGALPWIVSGLLCLFGCWLGCCLIPFCIPDLQDVQHRCPECYRVVAVFRRLS